MIGRILLIVLLILLSVLALALILPIHVRVSYDRGDLSAWMRYGPLKIPLFPRPEEGKSKSKDLEKKEKEKPTEDKPEKKEKKFKITSEQVFYTLETLPPILGRALRRIGRGLRMEPLKVHLLVAGSDPADTAMLYGKLQSALAAGLPVLHRLIRIKEQDIQLFLDFEEEQIDCIAEVGISLRGWTLVKAGLCAGASALKWYRGFKKLAGPPAREEQKPEDAKMAS